MCEKSLQILNSLRPDISPDDPAFRDLLEIELWCRTLVRGDVERESVERQHLIAMAQHQRSLAIKQVSALQRWLRELSADFNGSLPALPSAVKTRLCAAAGRPRAQAVRDQLEAFVLLQEQRDSRTARHSVRVGRLSFLLALELGISDVAAQQLELAARLHDFGKIAVPDVVLLKRQSLSALEREIIERHSLEGGQMLSDIASSMDFRRVHPSAEAAWLRLAAEIAYCHHEWWNGSGYPRAIAGERIPESARIVAVADVFDELIHEQEYRKAKSAEQALGIIRTMSGLRI